MDNLNKYENTIKELYDKVNELEHVIYKGNGKPALIVQIADLQHQLNSLDQNVSTRFESLLDTINAKFAHINTILSTYNNGVVEIDKKITQHIDNTEEMNINANSNKTAIIVAIIACVGSVLASMANVFIR